MEKYAKEAKTKPMTDVNRLDQRPPKLFKGESDEITFIEEDAKWVHHPYNDVLVFTVKIS